MEIRIKYAEGVKPVMQAHDGEWYDLRAAEDVTFHEGDIVIIPLGVCIQLPEGYEAIIKPRSSTSRKFGLVFADSGVIDNAYCGNDDWWGSTWLATKYGHIEKNTRIAQFRIQKTQPEAELITVTALMNDNRGGYGSSGAT
jgi:dUTP pyrophosphatase